MHLAIVARNLASTVNDNASIPRHPQRIAFHNAEAAPDLVVDARFLESPTTIESGDDLLRPPSPDMMFLFPAIESSMQFERRLAREEQ